MAGESHFPLLILIAAAVAAVPIIIWLVGRRNARERTDALKGLALRTGFTFVAGERKVDSSEPGAFSEFEPDPLTTLRLFQEGRDRKTSNLMVRLDGREQGEWVFDYSYVTGGGNSRKVHRQTVVGRRLSPAGSFTFLVQPEGFIARMFDREDIDFEQDAEFSKRYLLKSPDPHAARRAFTPLVRSFLLRRGGWAVEMNGPWLFAFVPGRRLKPEEISTFRMDVGQLMELLLRS